MLAQVAAWLVLGPLLSWSPLRAQTIDSTMWCLGPGDRVFATACIGDTVYLAGNFSQLGAASGGGVPIDRGTGLPVRPACHIAGSVYAVVPDGTGGWYVGGAFTAVNGRAHLNLAHILPDGPDESWRIDTNAEVDALSRSGDMLYVGGDFDTLGSVPRSHLAAIDLHAAATTPWNPKVNSRVLAIQPSGATIYIGGWFTTVGTDLRRYAAAIDSATGDLTRWNPSPNDFVLTLAVQDTFVFLGGSFTTVGGEYRFYLAQVGRLSGALSSWDAQLTRTPAYLYDGGPRVCSLIMRDSVMFVAGLFNAVAGQQRVGLAEIYLATARPTAWDAHASASSGPGAGFKVAALADDTLYVAGYADSVGGAVCESNAFCAVDVSSGERIAWDPRPNGDVRCIGLQGRELFAGGGFRSMGTWVERKGLAAIDLQTGRPTSWDPEPNYYVEAICAAGNTIYVGGPFSAVGGEARSGLAALDRVTGAPTAWNPGVNGGVKAMGVWGDRLLVGGLFSSVAGVPRTNVAAIDIVTGHPTPWNPGANDMVTSLLATDSLVFVGGNFSMAGGQPRNFVAAIDPSTGAAAPWTPVLDGWVNAMVVLDGSVYLGGDFNSVNGLERDGLAALDASGAVLPWTANASRQVYALAVGDSTIYAGGGFSSVGGEARFCLAAISARSGAIRDWYPAPDNVVWSVTVEHGSVFVGGAFSRIGNWPQAGLAVVSPSDPPGHSVGSRLWLSQSYPNPATTSASIQYILPEDAKVSVSVYDVQGREILPILSNEFQTAGQHFVSVATSQLRAGCYFYRIQTSVGGASKKMLILK